MKTFKDQYADALHNNDTGLIKHLARVKASMSKDEQIELENYVREINSQRVRLFSGR